MKLIIDALSKQRVMILMGSFFSVSDIINSESTATVNGGEISLETKTHEGGSATECMIVKTFNDLDGIWEGRIINTEEGISFYSVLASDGFIYAIGHEFVDGDLKNSIYKLNDDLVVLRSAYFD